MGLDITAYTNITPVPEPHLFNEDGEPVDSNGETLEGFIRLCDNSDFPERIAPFKDGWYFTNGEDFHFRAGSYGGYNTWREQLAELAGYPPKVPSEYHNPHAETAWESGSGPFFELIHFSDCEGTIGTTAAAKLAADFEQFQEKADAHPEEYFHDRYKSWAAAFALAAQNGAVDFR